MEVIEPIINYQKVTYEKLRELIEPEFVKGKTVNVYINMNSILNYFYAPATIDAMNSLRKFENIILVPEFINLIAHYRHYFYSRYQSSTRFIIYYMDSPVANKNKSYCENILKQMDVDNTRTGMMNDIIKTNIKMIDRICYYLQNVYFINSNGLEPSLIPYYLIKKLSKKEKQSHIVMTHDYYDYQLLNLDDTIVLSAAGSKSKVYTRDDIYKKMTSRIKYKLENDLSPELFSLIMSFTGNKTRNISKINNYGFAKTIKQLDMLISNGMLRNKYNSSIMTLATLFDVDYDELFNNFQLCDLKINHKLMNNIDEDIIKRKLINLKDNNTIMMLNSNYFPYNNIKLIELEEGEYVR